MELWPGEPYPLGASYNGVGTNFALFSEAAGHGGTMKPTQTLHEAGQSLDSALLGQPRLLPARVAVEQGFRPPRVPGP
jgi:hypothetical protein